MPIPFYEDLFLPVLQIINASENQKLTADELLSIIADQFNVFEEDNKELSLYEQKHRLEKTLARTMRYLYEAELICRLKDWRIGITNTALSILENPPAKIDHEFLFQFQSNKEWAIEFLKLKDFIDTLPNTITSPEFNEIFEEHFQPIAHLLFGKPKFKRDIHEFVCKSRWELGFIITLRGKRVYDEPFIQSFYPYGMKRLTAIEEEIKKERLGCESKSETNSD